MYDDFLAATSNEWKIGRVSQGGWVSEVDFELCLMYAHI